MFGNIYVKVILGLLILIVMGGLVLGINYYRGEVSLLEKDIAAKDVQIGLLNVSINECKKNVDANIQLDKDREAIQRSLDPLRKRVDALGVTASQIVIGQKEGKGGEYEELINLGNDIFGAFSNGDDGMQPRSSGSKPVNP